MMFFLSVPGTVQVPRYTQLLVLEKLHRKSQSLGVQIGISGIMYNIPVYCIIYRTCAHTCAIPVCVLQVVHVELPSRTKQYQIHIACHVVCIMYVHVM